MRLQPVAKDAGDDVIRTARQKADDELDRTGWKFVGGGSGRQQRTADQAEQQDNETNCTHDAPPRGLHGAS
jgi:hypothetical protein